MVLRVKVLEAASAVSIGIIRKTDSAIVTANATVMASLNCLFKTNDV